MYINTYPQTHVMLSCLYEHLNLVVHTCVYIQITKGVLVKAGMLLCYQSYDVIVVEANKASFLLASVSACRVEKSVVRLVQLSG